MRTSSLIQLLLCVGFLTVAVGATTIAQEKTADFPPPPSGFDVRRDNIEHGKIETVEYDSKGPTPRRKMVIYTPPGYSKDVQYPVLYLLHGVKFDETAWQKEGLADIILDNLYADKKLAPMIVVMPNGRAKLGDNSAASYDGFENDLLKEIIPFIESHYSVQADRDHRALIGQSMGGRQALTFGLKNLDTFAWLGGFSPALTQPAAKLVGDPSAAAKKLKFLWVSCGDKDPLLNTIKTFHTNLDDMKIPHIWHIGSGPHDFTVWKVDLYLAAPLLFREK